MSEEKFDFKETSRFEKWCPECRHKDVAENDTPCGRCIALSSSYDHDRPIYFVASDGEHTTNDWRNGKQWCNNCLFETTDKSCEPCVNCILPPSKPNNFTDARQFSLWCFNCVNAYSRRTNSPCPQCIGAYNYGDKPIFFEEQRRERR